MLYFRQINRAVDFLGTGSLKEEGWYDKIEAETVVFIMLFMRQGALIFLWGLAAQQKGMVITMKKMKAAFIGFLPEAGDVYQTLEDYAKIGYRAFEGGDLLFEKGDPAENLKRVEAIGMKPLACLLYTSRCV